MGQRSKVKDGPALFLVTCINVVLLSYKNVEYHTIGNNRLNFGICSIFFYLILNNHLQFLHLLQEVFSTLTFVTINKLDV